MITLPATVWMASATPHAPMHRLDEPLVCGHVRTVCGWEPAVPGHEVSADQALLLNAMACRRCWNLPAPEVTP